METVAAAVDADLDSTNGLIFACRLDGSGAVTKIGWEEINAWQPGDGVIWIHLHRMHPNAIAWLTAQQDVPYVAKEALLVEQTRPRSYTVERGLVAVLRGMHSLQETVDADLAAVRIWSDESRLISLRLRPLSAVRDLFESMQRRRNGPENTAQLFVTLASVISDELSSIVNEIFERLDSVEEGIESGDAQSLRRELSQLRQTCVELRRHVLPQRDALNRLQTDSPDWFARDDLLTMREVTDRLQRNIEEIETVRERAVVFRDEIVSMMSEKMNNTMFLLTIVSGVFLPISFLTGLLGINVGGMPGTDNPLAFWMVCGLLVVCVLAEILLLRKLRLISKT